MKSQSILNITRYVAGIKLGQRIKNGEIYHLSVFPPNYCKHSLVRRIYMGIEILTVPHYFTAAVDNIQHSAIIVEFYRTNAILRSEVRHKFSEGG